MDLCRLPDDELPSLQELFERVFKHPISSELLQWKYANRRGESWVAADVSGNIVMHCGLNFRDVLIGGERVRAAQLTDLMAPPKAQGLTRQESPFGKLMHRILCTLPRPDNPSGIAFGFPSDRAMRLGEHMGVYREVDRLMDLEFTPLDVLDAGIAWREITHFTESDNALVNRVWKAMAADFCEFSIGVRDSAYLKHRYLEHPEKQYSLLIVEKKGLWRNTPIGLAVVGPGHERRELLDIICPSKSMKTLIQATQCWLTEKKGELLKLSLTERFARQLESFACRCTYTEFRIMGNPLSPAISTTRLERRFWLTGGDTDYR